ncbi:hypothetical protein DVH26_01225 [Paenibacillus sp. H1-7]|uniref:hypothetical protein n=1 Tax=Paenibacillus sp. H1-7 TaxID=2282849 RepID=UPI001EF7AF7F|nr:hypothetical protein [Paenibacillus sp. H1-7]ULL13219.1 hypothetical protein DVH26_01225 [Paenibacillus sp. H1-7]
MSKKRWGYSIGICTSAVYLILTIVSFWFSEVILINRVGPVGNGPGLTTGELIMFLIHLILGVSILLLNCIALVKDKQK